MEGRRREQAKRNNSSPSSPQQRGKWNACGVVQQMPRWPTEEMKPFLPTGRPSGQVGSGLSGQPSSSPQERSEGGEACPAGGAGASDKWERTLPGPHWTTHPTGSADLHGWFSSSLPGKQMETSSQKFILQSFSERRPRGSSGPRASGSALPASADCARIGVRVQGICTQDPGRLNRHAVHCL